ncbi:MAG TPA: ABC transporter permease [Vicinamibacterales bacterium]|nr:ABC transporter permease [Vicinamibacterales bacterium]
MRWWFELWSDVRYGGRLLRRNPAFTFVAVTSLALGIAGAATVFSLVNAIVLRPLPVANAHELFLVNVARNAGHGDRISAPLVEDAQHALGGRAEVCAASTVAAMQLWPSGDAAAERGRVQLVSGEYFDVLRQRPQLGRLLQPADNAMNGGRAVAVISDPYWRRHFQASASVVGRAIAINGVPFTIVGVAPRGFFGTTVGVRTPDAWIPFVLQPAVHYAGNASNSNGDTSKPWPPQREISWLTLFVRVPPPTPVASIAAAMSLVVQRDAAALLPRSAADAARQQARDTRATLEPAPGGVSTLRNDTSTPLLVLLAMVGVLLAIASGNVAGLLLSRATSREREVAIRVSIGAGRSRILRQFVAESLLLGIGAGAAGLALAVWLHDPLLKLFVPGATTIDLDTGVDWRVLLFVAAISIAVGVACGVVPGLRGSRVAPVESLKEHSRAVGAGRRALMTGRALVTAQMAFSLLLLIVAGLFSRSLQLLAHTDVGFDRDHLLVAALDVRGAGYAASERLAVYQRLLDRLQRVPGIASASLSENGPMNNSSWRSSFSVEGHTARPGEALQTNEEVVTGDYFRTVGLRLIEGRLFDAEDRHPGTHSTIVNATMAKRFFPGQSAIGKRWSYGDAIDAKAFTIVGVVEDAHYLNVRDTPPNMAYHPAEFDTDEVLGDIELRTAGTPSALVQPVRQALAEVEPRLPVSEVVPFADRISRDLSQDRLVAELSTAFGSLALALACLGLYGTISYGISRRIAELGLRMALGADRGSVVRMIMREALGLVAIGALAGLPLAFIAARSVGALLYGVPPADLMSFAGGSAVLIAVAAAAAYVPAHRASRISPMVALNR